MICARFDRDLAEAAEGTGATAERKNKRVAQQKCGIVSGLFLIVALFSGVMWLFTHSPHAFHTMLGFLGYAAVPFALIVAMTYYHGKLTDWLNSGQHRRPLNRSGRALSRERAPQRIWR